MTSKLRTTRNTDRPSQPSRYIADPGQRARIRIIKANLNLRAAISREMARQNGHPWPSAF
jgi:hypothetical protein